MPLEDIWTIVWKEWKEFFLQRGSSKRVMLASSLLPVILLGIVVPLRASNYVSNPLSLIPPALMPLLFIMALMADSFAGERERHTLETLLATRLSDRSILAGKITAGVLYACGVLCVTLILGMISNSIAFGHGRLLIFPIKYLWTVFVFDFLLVVLLSCVGVFVSLRAGTVRQALQTLNLGFVIVIGAASFVFSLLPAHWQKTLIGILAGENLREAEIVAGISLIALDLVLLAAARVRFQRSRLILD